MQPRRECGHPATSVPFFLDPLLWNVPRGHEFQLGRFGGGFMQPAHVYDCSNEASDPFPIGLLSGDFAQAVVRLRNAPRTSGIKTLASPGSFPIRLRGQGVSTKWSMGPNPTLSNGILSDPRERSRCWPNTVKHVGSV